MSYKDNRSVSRTRQESGRGPPAEEVRSGIAGLEMALLLVKGVATVEGADLGIGYRKTRLRMIVRRTPRAWVGHGSDPLG
jgi:hypothetical protein